MADINRRPIKTRSKAWVTHLAARVAKSGLSPNQISLLGAAISSLGALAMFGSISIGEAKISAGILLLLAAATIQLRLLCNMLDGLVAVEYGKKSKLGDLYNEVPDRLEDTMFIVAAGYASGTPLGIVLGWLGAIMAVGTAYIRLLGGSLGFPQDFCGPIAKPQRMFFLTVALIAAALEIWISESRDFITYGLTIIVVGSAITLIRRLLRIAKAMNER